MTNTEKLARLRAFEDRAYAALETVEPGTDKAWALLQSLTRTESLDTYLDAGSDKRTPLTAMTDAPAPAPEAPKTAGRKKKATTAPSSEPTSATMEEPAAEPEAAPEPEPTMTKDQVRTELSRLANEKGVDIAAVMRGMGYSKLSEIPAEKYAELLEKAKEAA